MEQLRPLRARGKGARDAYHERLAEGMCPGYAAEDGAALHFVGSKLAAVVASRPEARGRCVGDRGDRVIETRAATRYLGEAAPEPGAGLDAVARLRWPPEDAPRRGRPASSRSGGARLHARARETEALHDYVLSLAERPRTPRICLLPTASGDPDEQIVRFHGASAPRLRGLGDSRSSGSAARRSRCATTCSPRT